MKLAHKLSLAFVVLISLPVVLLGYFLFRVAADTIEHQTLDHLASINQVKASEFGRWLSDNELRLELLSQRPLVRDGLAILVAKHRIVYHSADPVLRAAHEQEHERLLADHLRPPVREGGFTEVLILDPETGEVLLSTDRSQEGMYRDSDPYFVEGRRATYTQDPYYSISREAVLMTVGTPVISSAGELVAVLVGHLDLDELSKIMVQGWELTDTEDSYIVNRAAQFVTEPRFGEDLHLLRGARSEGVERATAGEIGTAMYPDYRGIEVFGAYVWIPERELAILTEMDLHEALGPILRVRTTLLTAGILTAGIGIVFGLMFAGGLVRPARHLLQATEELGRGNLDHRVNMTSRDELGKLGSAFNTMADNLHLVTASRNDLEREVTAREAAERRLEATIRSLRESDEKFRLLTEESPVGVFISSEMKLRYVNPAFESIFGYSRDELLGRIGPMEMIDPAQHEETGEYIGRCYAGIPDLPPLPFRGIRKDGRTIFCEALARPIDYEG
ncbi:PAS domain S-box protein, partial [Candidatus Bipolaricaulota bacterium]|nr:PAS domain S-box protein [Candidatus Bipolaricaulota bacterium]